MKFFAKFRVKRSKKFNFEYGVRPIYYFLRLMGLWPFSIVHGLNGSIQETKVRFIDVVWFLISIALYLAAAFSTFERIKQIPYPNLMITIFNYIAQTLGLACGALHIAMDLCSRKRIGSFLDMFRTFDNEVCVLFICELDTQLQSMIHFLMKTILGFQIGNSVQLQE